MRLGKINKHFFGDESSKNQSYIYLNGEVSHETTAPVIQEIISVNLQKQLYEEKVLLCEGNPETLEELLDDDDEPEDVINLFICTPGGDATAAFSLISMIEASEIPVRTIALGEAGSAGLMILMSGHQRVATPYSSILSHQFSSGVEGSYADVKKSVIEFDNYNEKIIQLYVKHTGLPKAKIKKCLLSETDNWLTPDQALKFNLIDIVSDLS